MSDNIQEKYKQLLHLFLVANKYFIIIFFAVFIVVVLFGEHKHIVFPFETIRIILFNPLLLGVYLLWVLV